MIPKIIHYCWFGRNPLPELAQKCIASWKKYLPDYEIKEWNEDNFDVNIIPYTAEAYKEKKYAFVSDYARFWILYNYGGLYFDTDVEIIKPMDDIIARGPFMGCEAKAGNGVEKLNVASGLGLGACPRMSLYKELVQLYDEMSFADSKENGDTVVTYITKYLISKGLKDIDEIQQVAGLWIYPKDFLCPKDYNTGKLCITNSTVAIHHYGATWLPFEQRIEHRIWQVLGLRPHRIMWHVDKWFRKIGINR